MQVTLALLADAANVSREGKLNLLGNFDTIYARSFPTAHAHMQLVLRFEADASEVGTTRTLEVTLVAPDGSVVGRVPGRLAVPRPEAGEVSRVDHILTLTNVTFAGPGRYTFQIALDGVVLRTVALRVEQIPVAH